ncbi:MAG: hypothetical protein AAF378_05560 [Cyanobacteria bacterium P01_A01_bin.84]
MKKSKQILVSGISLIAISTISVASVNAQSFSPYHDLLDEYLEQTKEQIERQVKEQIEEPIKDWNDSISQKLKKDLQAAVNELGELGLPDPTKIRQDIFKSILDDVNNPKALINYLERITNQLEREITRLVTDSTLGEVGQQLIKQELGKTSGRAAKVYSIFDKQTKGRKVTQDVMKDIAEQNIQIANILASVRNDGLQLQKSQDLANLNLTNISRAIDGQNQARATEIVSQGFANYRTAAKATLSFSDENKSSKNKNEQQKK